MVSGCDYKRLISQSVIIRGCCGGQNKKNGMNKLTSFHVLDLLAFWIEIRFDLLTLIR